MNNQKNEIGDLRSRGRLYISNDATGRASFLLKSFSSQLHKTGLWAARVPEGSRLVSGELGLELWFSDPWARAPVVWKLSEVIV